MAQTTHAQIVDKICEELKSIDTGIKIDLSADTNMTTDIKVDSLDVMELVFALEEAFDASIPVNDLSDVFTIGELASLVQKNMD